ncbi:MAG: aminoglycoside phosphotransferase family protein [Candidatus Moranbacteria bacterium]|nr:aminoglycoside phosphotransferase family protein [Candidatus Moranbacteria bacterium]MDD3964850.1 aminoglycoside phosphotransferase family protein [Candidatus Moranbacteria bacterium]
MNNSDFQTRLCGRIEEKLKIRIVDMHIPPQGMSSKVFFVKSDTEKKYAIKYGNDVTKDVSALKLIMKEGIDIPVPRLYASFLFEETPIIILEKINFPLLESVSKDQMPKYIPSMIGNLRKLHSIKFDRSGSLIDSKSEKSWKEMLSAIFDGDEFDWNEIAKREGLDTELVLSSVEKIREKINNTVFEEGNYSLLHTDFNQRNLFVDPKSDEITGIIDWEEALFGDPLYDFARVRMFMWHFGFDNSSIQAYYDLMNYTDEQKALENLYRLVLVIQYLAWYSEDLSEFARGRIKLHQDYLRTYNWEK